MAIAYTGSSSQYTITDSFSWADDEPLTMACWFYTGDTTTDMNLMSVGTSTNNFRYWRIGVNITTNDAKLNATKSNNGSGASSATSSNTFSANTWAHACGVFTSSTSRTSYLNGTGNSSATSRTTDAVTYSRLSVGARILSSSQEYFTGRIMVPAIWDAALSADEVAALARGIHPLCIRRQSLIFLSDFIGRRTSEIDVIGGITLTHTNSPTQGSHGRLIYAANEDLTFAAPVGGGSSIPNFIHHYKQQGARG